jgi:hypothetical protein
MEIDLRLSIPMDNLVFNNVMCLTHRYAILTTESTDRAYAVTLIEKKTFRIGDFVNKLFF